MCFDSAAEYVMYLINLPGAAKNLEVDRINNDGHYERGNLRWASHVEQSKNRRDTRYVLYKGQQYVFFDFVRNFTNVSTTKASQLLREGFTTEQVAEYIPQDVGRRAQGVRLGKLRPSKELRSRG